MRKLSMQALKVTITACLISVPLWEMSATTNAFAAKAPPVVFHGGAVMATPTVITPIYWDPSSTFSASYKAITDGFLNNVAADSGKLTNFFSDLLQYDIPYSVEAGTPVIDTDGIVNGCTPQSGPQYSDNSGYTQCITSDQTVAEVQAVVSAHSLPADLAHLYVIFLPKGVESQDSGCSYHSSDANAPPILDSIPFPSGIADDCAPSTIEAPNGNADADLAVGLMSHEIMEAISNPEDSGGWWSPPRGSMFRSGGEIADPCGLVEGNALGGSPGSLYNQVINGDHYYVQEMFSNENYVFGGKKKMCIQRVDMPTATLKVSPKHPSVGHSVRFNAKKPEGYITSYSWNFGDGSPAGSGMSTTHTYASARAYTVTLTLTDVTGLQHTSATTSEVLTVR